jgi:hypothetical protein
LACMQIALFREKDNLQVGLWRDKIGV